MAAFLLGLCAAIGLFAGMNMRQAQQPNSNAKEQANIPHNNVQKLRMSFPISNQSM